MNYYDPVFEITPYDLYLAHSYTGLNREQILKNIKNRTRAVNRRASDRGIGSRIYKAEILRLLNASQWHCIYTGGKGPMSLDHVRPLAEGGTNTVWNLLPTLHEVNVKKGSMSLDEWLMEIKLDRETFDRRRRLIYRRWVGFTFGDWRHLSAKSLQID